MRSPRATPITGVDEGIFLVRVLHESKWKYITTVRNVPVKVQTMTFTDPFGPASAEIELPAVTSFDRFGAADLEWLTQWRPIDIVWSGREPFVWEGFIASIEVGDSVRIQCKGALHIVDNFLAAPYYPTNPIPYETLIKRHITRPNTGLKAMRMDFPEGWNVTAQESDAPEYLWMLPPWGLSTGQPWSGLATRSTGSWDPSLTGFTQSLLSTMYTPEGDQWTLMLDRGRQPVLKVRHEVHQREEDTIVLYNGSPGVSVSLSKDWSQSANVLYGEGTDFSGIKYSNVRVTPDGSETFYEPFAYNAAVHPNDRTNPYLNPNSTRKEGRLNFFQGIDLVSAQGIAQAHLRKFADPGWTGQVNLEVDPIGPDGVPINKHLLRAGRTILVRNWCGGDVLLHVTSVTSSPEEGTVSLTVDSRYRDALTAQEVYARTRDALNPINLLHAGRLSITINDLIKPWSYEDGSGIIPTPAKDLFSQKEAAEGFPWRSLTQKFPPKDYPQFYVKVAPRKKYGVESCWQRTEHLAEPNEANYHPAWSQAIVVKMAQAGTIRLSEIAAYDRNGNVLPVEFHVSVYDNTVDVSNMPYPPSPDTPRRDPHPNPGTHTDRYPFFKGAFDQFTPRGEQKDEGVSQLTAGVQMNIGWGTYHEPAGYFPGTYSTGGQKTGLLVDEAPWQFDTTNSTHFDPRSASKTQANAEAGCLYVMIYCDDTLDAETDVYFLGRFWNTSHSN